VDDDDSIDGSKPIEGFDPDYGSVPMARPSEPPPYKAAPGYGHGGELCVSVCACVCVIVVTTTGELVYLATIYIMVKEK